MKSIFEYQVLHKETGFTIKQYLQPFFSSPFHFHDVYEVILIANSYGKLYVGNEVTNFIKNDVFMFGPGLSHCFFNEKSFVSTGETAHAIVVFFKEDFLRKDFFLNSDLIKTKELLRNAAYGIKINRPNERTQLIFSRIPETRGLDTLILFLQLLNILSNSKSDITLINSELSKGIVTENDSSRLDVVFKYIFENFKDDLNLKQAASFACLNEAAFCRYFKSRTEQTFSQFVNRVRIAHAMQLLVLEERSISDICFECGYQNISYFNRQFKDITGKTPLAYRNDLLLTDDNLVTETEEEFG
jgi:AraC-like DNA-binding protein